MKRTYFIVPGQNLTRGEGIQMIGKDNKTYTYYNNSLAYACDPRNCTCDPKKWQPLHISNKGRATPFEAHANGNTFHHDCLSREKENDSSIYIGNTTQCGGTWISTGNNQNGTYWVEG
ncbi:hypothetical protein CHARACLAT_033639, partial [Characodon lateralis]|nr:hypothetical protein [Characodon lateralis]